MASDSSSRVPDGRGPHDHEELVVDVEQPENRSGAAQFTQFGFGGRQAGQRGGTHRRAAPFAVFAHDGHAEAVRRVRGRSCAGARCAPMGAYASPRPGHFDQQSTPAARPANKIDVPTLIAVTKTPVCVLGSWPDRRLGDARGDRGRPRGLRLQPVGRGRRRPPGPTASTPPPTSTTA